MATTIDQLKKQYIAKAASSSVPKSVLNQMPETIKNSVLTSNVNSGTQAVKYASQPTVSKVAATTTLDPDREFAKKIAAGGMSQSQIDAGLSALANGQNPNDSSVMQAAQTGQTDSLINSLITKLLGQQQSTADFDSYLKNWKPDMSQDDYVNTAVNAITAAANSKYDNGVASIRKRVANILAGLTSQMSALPQKYQGAYEQNTQNAYDQNESLKSIMARRGLLTSGVDLGNQMGNANAKNVADSNVTQQLNTDKTNLNDQMNIANSDAENDISAAEMARQDEIASGKAQASKDYIDYVDKQKQFASDNFWKGANYNLDAQKVRSDLLAMAGNYTQNAQKLNQDADQFNRQLEQNAQQFAADNGLEYAKLSQNDKQFYAQLAQDKAQFDAKQSQDADQFAATMGLNRAELTEKAREFDRQLGYDYANLSSENQRAANQLAYTYAQNDLDYQLSKQKMQDEMTQFQAEMKVRLDEDANSMDLQTKNYFQNENDRIDKVLLDYTSPAQLAQLTTKQAKQSFMTKLTSIINSSGLTGAMKQEKLKMLSEAAK